MRWPGGQRRSAERGHCKHTEEDASGHVCFIGAVNLAAFGVARRHGFDTGTDVTYRVLRMAGRILARRNGVTPPPWEISSVFSDLTAGWWRSPIWWNNAEDTGGEDVVLLLKETAAALEEAGL